MTKKKSIAINTGANFACRVWTILANFIFVPIFIKFLGLEAYGLVTFFTTLQIVLDLLGLGLSKTLRREFAADERSGKDTLYKYKILRTIEIIYWGICIIIVLICFSGADYISTQWLSASGLSSNTISTTILLMGGCISSQLLANLYLGCIFGVEKQVEANTLQVSWSFLRNVGVIFVLAYISSDVIFFYSWFLLCDILYFVVARYRIVSHLHSKRTILSWQFKDISLIQGVYKYALGLMVVSLGYCINTQLDKVILSGKFDLVTVGAYNTAYSLSILSTILSTAVGIAIFPRFTALFSMHETRELNNLYCYSNCFVNIFTLSVGCFLSAFSHEILLVWTGSPEIADIVKYAAPIIILGSTMNALQEISYNYLLANGITIVNNVQTILSIIYVVIFTPLLIKFFGINGAAISWIVLMTVSTTGYLIYFNYKFNGVNFKKNLIINTLIPYGIALIVSLLSHWAVTQFTNNTLLICFCGIVLGFITFIILIRIICPNIITIFRNQPNNKI